MTTQGTTTDEPRLTREERQALDLLRRQLADIGFVDEADIDEIVELARREFIDPEFNFNQQLTQQFGYGGGRVRTILDEIRRAEERVQTIGERPTEPTEPGPSEPEPGDLPPEETIEIGDTTIPAGARLIAITDPAGSDAGRIFYLEYTAFGVPIRFEIGNAARLNELFGGIDAFDSYTTMTQRDFDAIDGLLWGSVDEIIGTDESLASQIERELRNAGMEDLAPWMRNSSQVMLILATAARDGWSSGRALLELSQTDAFNERFSGFAEWQQITGQQGSIGEQLDAYVAQESSLEELLRRFRGPNTDTSNEYIGEIIAAGWMPEEVMNVLEFENRLVQSPEALDLVNGFLEASGQAPVDASGLLDILEGNAPTEITELMNDALRQWELAQAGIDISDELAFELGSGTAFGLQDAASLQQQAQQVAMDIFVNQRDIDLGRFGVNQEDILLAAFNGEASVEVASTLAQLARERSTAAQGFEQFTGFTDERGRLRTQGLAGL